MQYVFLNSHLKMLKLALLEPPYENQTHYILNYHFLKCFRTTYLLQAEYNQSGPLANFARYGIIVPLVVQLECCVKREQLNGQRLRAAHMEKQSVKHWCLIIIPDRLKCRAQEDASSTKPLSPSSCTRLQLLSPLDESRGHICWIDWIRCWRFCNSPEFRLCMFNRWLLSKILDCFFSQLSLSQHDWIDCKHPLLRKNGRYRV